MAKGPILSNVLKSFPFVVDGKLTYPEVGATISVAAVIYPGLHAGGYIEAAPSTVFAPLPPKTAAVEVATKAKAAAK